MKTLESTFDVDI